MECTGIGPGALLSVTSEACGTFTGETFLDPLTCEAGRAECLSPWCGWGCDLATQEGVRPRLCPPCRLAAGGSGPRSPSVMGWLIREVRALGEGGEGPV